MYDLVEHARYLLLALELIALSQHNFQQASECVTHVHLNEAELFVTFVFEDLAEQLDLVVGGRMFDDAVDYRDGPLNNETLESILLVEVRVQVAFERLTRLLRLLRSLVELDLLAVDVSHGILQLLQGQLTVLHDAQVAL